MKKRMTLVLAIIVALVTGLMVACAAPAPTPAPSPPPTPTLPEPCEFPDENLEAAISDALGKPAGEAITPAELAGLTELSATMQSITDLSGIEYCANLTNLYLSYNQISDISPLLENSGLGKEDQLDLYGNNLDLLEGSEDMGNIRKLEERGVEVSY